MKTFCGKQYLQENAVSIELSNGLKFIVEEIPQGLLTELAEVPDDATDAQILGLLAKFLGTEASNLQGIGLLETKGAIDFLANNLLSSNSVQKTTQD